MNPILSWIPTDDAATHLIYFGTDKGMPTWKEELSRDKIWKVLAYVESLRK